VSAGRAAATGGPVTVSDALCSCDRCVPADDLIARLQQAASAAIENERSDLAYRPEQVRGLMIELELGNGGSVVDVTAHVTRKYVHRYRREPAG
jgi:hypothetical protein